jgi:outer membrane protein assembly factor BamB
MKSILPGLLTGSLLLSAAMAGETGPSAGAVTKDVPLGHKDFCPSPQYPVGFRGDGSGHFPGATPPVTWNALTGEGVVWKTALPGTSFSSAIVVGRKVFAVSSPHHLFCLDADSGQILWQKDVDPIDMLAKEGAAEVRQALATIVDGKPLGVAYGSTAEVRQALAALVEEVKTQPPSADKAARGALHRKATVLAVQGAVADGLPYGGLWAFAPATPASDGTRVYVQFRAGVLAAYTLDGTQVWQVPALTSGWSMGYSSPVVCQGRVLAICRNYADKSGLPALLCVDAATGKEQWRTIIPNGISHTGPGSPAVVQTADGWKVVVPVFKLFDLATGKPWKTHAFYTAWGGTPVVDGRRVFYAHGDRTPYQLAVLDTAVAGEGEGLTAWPRQSSCKFHGSLLVVDGKAYLPDGAGCTPELIDLATGQVLVVPDAKKPLRKGAFDGYTGISPSPALAGGRIYQAFNDGQVAVIEPSVPLKLVAANPGTPTHGSPFFQGSRIFLRTLDAVVCIGGK